ncbi:hypothetical protein AB6A40_010446 [Gnathostoma spinigerum]|uniref:dihydrofolate reductase n=1 Tax=Gnathostoma spinigerum TaxID=75299 RepID=A0ABD6F2R6_9BILA
MTLESNENVVVERSFEDAVERLCSMSDIETIWNIGGSAVYAKGLQSPLLHQLFLTRVEGSFNADVFFPKIDYKLFGEPEQTYPGQESEIKENNISYRFETLTKKQN